MSGPRPLGGVAPQRHPGHQLAATSSPLTSSVSSPSITSSLALASDSVLMQRRTTAHTPCCSASTMPTRRITEGRSGKMPTTSVRLRISLLRRSWRLVDQIWLHHHGGHGNLRQTLHLKGIPVDVGADGPKREPRTPVPRALNGLFRPPRSAVKLRSGTELAAMPSLPGLSADPPKSFDLGDPLPRREPSGRGLLVPGDRRPDRGGEADDWRRRGRQRTSALVAVPRRMIVRRAAGLAATGPARLRPCCRADLSSGLVHQDLEPRRFELSTGEGRRRSRPSSQALPGTQDS